MKPSITQLHMDFLTLSPEMQTYIKSQEDKYWALAADSLGKFVPYYQFARTDKSPIRK